VTQCIPKLCDTVIIVVTNYYGECTVGNVELPAAMAKRNGQCPVGSKEVTTGNTDDSLVLDVIGRREEVRF